MRGLVSQTYYAMQIMEWLERLNVVHLDLKPDNCIRTEAGKLKLCDAAGLMRIDTGEPSAALSWASVQCHKLCTVLTGCALGWSAALLCRKQNKSRTVTVSCCRAGCRPGRGCLPSQHHIRHNAPCPVSTCHSPGGWRCMLGRREGGFGRGDRAARCHLQRGVHALQDAHRPQTVLLW